MPQTRTRKNVPKGWITTVWGKAAPGSAVAAAKRAAARPTIDRGAKILVLVSPLGRTASRNMISTPVRVRMISGRKRRYSALVGIMLAGSLRESAQLHIRRGNRYGPA